MLEREKLLADLNSTYAVCDFLKHGNLVLVEKNKSLENDLRKKDVGCCQTKL